MVLLFLCYNKPINKIFFGDIMSDNEITEYFGVKLSDLIEVKSKYGTENLTICAKNIRKLLKSNFPGTKFKVKTSRFSMGDSVTVSWELDKYLDKCPDYDAVDKIIKVFREGDYNGREDLFESTENDMHKYGSAKYISTSPDRLTEDECIRRKVERERAEIEKGLKESNMIAVSTKQKARI